MCIYACQSLKFDGGTMVVMVPRQYLQLMNCEGSAMQWSPGNIIFAGCRTISCASWFLVGLAVFPQLWQLNLLRFCCLRRILKHCLHIVAELIISMINTCNSQNNGWKTRCAWAASYFIDHFHTFCMANENELTSRGAWESSRDPIVQIGHCRYDVTSCPPPRP